jgi:hypothetical protein
MSRRKFIAVLGGAAVVAGDVPVVVWAQRVLARAPDELPRVILVSAGDGADPASRTSVVAFEQGLSAAGWSAGVNMRLDYRWLGADDLTKRAAAAVAEIAGLRPTVTGAVGAAVSWQYVGEHRTYAAEARRPHVARMDPELTWAARLL